MLCESTQLLRNFLFIASACPLTGEPLALAPINPLCFLVSFLPRTSPCLKISLAFSLVNLCPCKAIFNLSELVRVNLVPVVCRLDRLLELVRLVLPVVVLLVVTAVIFPVCISGQKPSDLFSKVLSEQRSLWD